MKHMKKLIVAVLSLAMVMGMMTMTFAQNANLSGHTYKAYQIFSGTQAADSAKLASVQWGDGINKDDFLTALKADETIGSTFTSCTTAAQVAEAMGNWDDDSEQAKAFAKIADANKKGDGAEIGDTLAAGYYLVVDKTATSGETNTVKNLSLLQLTNKGTFEIKTKADYPTVEKKVLDNEQDGYQDSADYAVNDDVPFQLTATMPSTIDGYDTYKIVFHDTLSAGLTYKEVTSITVAGTDHTDGFTISAEGQTLTISCDDVLDLGATANSKIVVSYTATLNDQAVIGSAGNDNKVYLEYSNNPNSDGSGETGNTPEDKVKVFTYKVVINKTDGTKPLNGAGFTLYKKNAEGTYVAIGTELKAAEGKTMTTFTWERLDAGEYKLEETTVPAGYNKAADIEFTITASHDANADDPKLTVLNVTPADKLSATLETGTVAGTVVNNSGSTLPETGGMGTTMFYLIGGILVIGAGLVLVTRRRMDA